MRRECPWRKAEAADVPFASSILRVRVTANRGEFMSFLRVRSPVGRRILPASPLATGEIMTPHPIQYLTMKRKKEIFKSLVAIQDSRQMGVAESKRFVAKRYDVTLKQIEQTVLDGIDLNWLDELDTIQATTERDQWLNI